MKLNSNNLRVKTCKSSERKRRMTVTSVKWTNRLPERPKERKLSHLVVCQTNESEKWETETVISKNIELKSLWGECDEAIIHAIADRCKVLEENKLQNKLEFFYGSLGIKIDNIPSQPMKFENEVHKNATHQETEEFYKKKAQDNWGKLSKTIISKDCGKFRELIKTINSSTYPELKEYAKNNNVIRVPNYYDLFKRISWCQ